MVVIYANKHSSRLTYVLDEIFVRRMDLTYRLVHDIDKWQQAPESIKVYYGQGQNTAAFVNDSGLLWETNIPSVKPNWSVKNNVPVLFASENGFCCDIFSMAFWLLSRAEEYLHYIPDEHGRFPANQSHIPEQWRTTPVLDQVLHLFYAYIGLKSTDKYAIYPTLDIDIAFKHKGRSWYTWLGGLVQNMAKGGMAFTIERIRVLFGSKDPSDTFDYMHRVLEKHQKNTRFFIQVSKRSTFDKSIPINNKSYQKILQNLYKTYAVGLHPGYAKGSSLEGILEEKNILESDIKKTIDRSRHHFLKIQIPTTYRHLTDAKITHDYSMGFADGIGFRAGTAQSFYFYDLQKEQTTSLVIHPFCMMDVTLKNYLKLSPDLAIAEVQKIKRNCQVAQTPFCFIFHNESLSESGEWKGWSQVFEACLK